MSVHIKRLEASGWLVREADGPDADRRRVRLTLSAKGEEALGAIRRSRNDWLEARLMRLSPEDLETLGGRVGPLDSTCGDKGVTLEAEVMDEASGVMDPTSGEGMAEAILAPPAALAAAPKQTGPLLPMIIGAALFMQTLDFHRHLQRPAHHGPRPAPGSGHSQSGDHRLPSVGRRVPTDLRLGRRHLRRQECLSRSDCRLRAEFAFVRRVSKPAGVGGRSHAAGSGGRHDASSRSAGASSQRTQIRPGPGDDLPHHAGAARAHPRAADRRLHRHVLFVALDLLHQHSHGRSGHRLGHPVHS